MIERRKRDEDDKKAAQDRLRYDYLANIKLKEEAEYIRLLK